MTVIVALLGLILLIVIHELGHMLTAKALGVRVPEFGIGFGPALVKKKIGKTVYSFRIILLGGFAKMAGMGGGEYGAENELLGRKNILEEQMAQLGQELEPFLAQRQNLEGGISQATNELNALQDQKDTLESQMSQTQPELATLQDQKHTVEAQIHAKQRQLGQTQQALNALLAKKQSPEAEIQQLRAMPGNHTEQIRQVHEQLNELNSQIAQKQLQIAQLTNDIVNLQHQLQQWEEQIAQKQQQILHLQQEIAQLQQERQLVNAQKAQKKQQLQQVVDQVTQKQQQLAQLQSQLQAIDLDTFPAKPPWRRALIILAGPVANMLAAVVILAGIYMFQGVITDVKPVVNAVEPGSMAQQVGIRAGDRIVGIDGERIEGWNDFERQMSGREPGEKISVTVLRDGSRKTFEGELGADPEDRDRALVGVRPEVETTTYGPLKSVGLAVQRCGEITVKLGAFVGQLVTGEKDLYRNVTGPVGIASVGSTAVSQGFFLPLLALISLNLALFNLLPILPLDGGHLFFIAAEKVLGRPVSEQTMGKIAAFGLVLVLALFLFATYADLSKIFTGQPFIPD
jgi:regulator of sigma E protease